MRVVCKWKVGERHSFGLKEQIFKIASFLPQGKSAISPRCDDLSLQAPV